MRWRKIRATEKRNQPSRARSCRPGHRGRPRGGLAARRGAEPEDRRGLTGRRRRAQPTRSRLHRAGQARGGQGRFHRGPQDRALQLDRPAQSGPRGRPPRAQGQAEPDHHQDAAPALHRGHGEDRDPPPHQPRADARARQVQPGCGMRAPRAGGPSRGACARRRARRVPRTKGRQAPDRSPPDREPVCRGARQHRSAEPADRDPRDLLERGEREPHLLPRPSPSRRDEGARVRSRHVLPVRRRRRGRRGRGSGRGRGRGADRRGGPRGGRVHGRAARRGDRGRRRYGGRSRGVNKLGGLCPPAPGVLPFLLALAFAASCTQSVQPRPSPSRDVDAAPKLARDAGAILLQFSAYDYGLAGALGGEKTRTVAPVRYGTIAQASAKAIAAFNGSVLAATVDRSGPVRERLVPLADGLAALATDGAAYADAGDAATFARVISGVTAGWERLRELSAVVPKDDALQNVIARGTSFVVTVKSATSATVTAGPYASLTDASQALRAMGSPMNATVTKTSPFVVRLGPYADRPAADAAAAELAKQGITSVVTDEQSYTFTRSGPVPDAELWRDPSRVQDARGTSRKLAVSGDGSWLVTGGDDGYAAVFDPSGALRALPQFYAGVSVFAFDVEVFRPGRDADPRAIARVPGVGRALAVDRAGKTAAAITDQGTYWIDLTAPSTVSRRISPTVRDVAFGIDGSLYLLDQTALVAYDTPYSVRWTAPLVDGRRLVAARRAVVLDGADRLLAFAPADGAADELGAGGTITDVTMSRDGHVIGAIVDTRRAVLFTLP